MPKYLLFPKEVIVDRFPYSFQMSDYDETGKQVGVYTRSPGTGGSASIIRLTLEEIKDSPDRYTVVKESGFQQVEEIVYNPNSNLNLFGGRRTRRQRKTRRRSRRRNRSRTSRR